MYSNNKWRSFIALIVAVCMLAASLPLTVLAEEIGSNKKETLKYVSLGDSMTNGYGFDDYYVDGQDHGGYGVKVPESYPALFAEWLAEEYDCEVDWSQLAVSCTRAEDLAFILNYDKSQGFPTCYQDMDNFEYGDYSTYEEFIENRWEYALGSNNNRINMNADNLQKIADAYQNAVAEADVVTLAVGGANIGVIMLHDLLAAFGVSGYNQDDWGHFDLEDAYKNLDSKLVRISNKVTNSQRVKNLVNTIIEAIEPTLTANGLTVEQVDAVCDIVTYTVVSYLASYIEDVDRIIELNPDVDLIVLGVMNSFSGLTLRIDEDTVIDMGELFDTIILPINTFLAGYPTIAQGLLAYEDADIYYAECDSLEVFISEFANGRHYSVVRERMVNEFIEDYNLLQAAVIDTVVGGTAKFVDLVEEFEEVEKAGDAESLEAFYKKLDSAYSTNAPAVAQQIALFCGYEKLIDNAAGLTELDASVLTELSSLSTLPGIDTITTDIVSETLSIASNGEQENKDFVNKITYDIAVYYADKAGVSLLGLFAAITDELGGGTVDSAMQAVVDQAKNALIAIYAMRYLKQAITEVVNEEDYPSLLSLMNIYGRFLAANGIGAHPNANGCKQLFNAIIEVYPNKPVAYSFQELSHELVLTLVDYATEYGEVAVAGVFASAIGLGLITQSQAQTAVALVMEIVNAADTGDTDAALTATKTLLKKVNNFVLENKDDVIAFVKPYAIRLINAIERYVETYGPEALVKVKEHIVKKGYISAEDAEKIDSQINALVAAYESEDNEAVASSILMLSSIILKYANDAGYVDDGEGYTGAQYAIEMILNYINGMPAEEAFAPLVDCIKEFIEANKAEALVAIQTYIEAQGWLTADEQNALVEKISAIIVAAELGDQDSVELLVNDLVKALFLLAVDKGYINAEDAEAAEQLLVLLNDIFHFFADNTEEQRKAIAIAQIQSLIESQIGTFSSLSEAKAYAIKTLKEYLNQKGVEALYELEAYLYEQEIFTPEEHEVLKIMYNELKDAYEEDPAKAEAMIEEIIDELLNELVEEGKLDKESLVETQKIALSVKLAVDFIGNATEEEIKLAAATLIGQIIDEEVTTVIGEGAASLLKSAVSDLIMMFGEASVEDYEALALQYIAAIEFDYLRALGEATEGDFYYTTEDSYYLALGGKTLGGYGITREEATYAEIFADFFNVASKSVSNMTTEELLAWVLSNPEEVEKADFITLQADASDLILAICNGESPDWSNIFSDEELEFVEAAIPVIKEILAQDWDKYADLDAMDIAEKVEDEVFAKINEKILEALKPINSNLTTLYQLCVAEVKNYFEYAQYEAQQQIAIPVLEEIKFVNKVFEVVEKIINADLDAYGKMRADLIVKKIMVEVRATVAELKEFSAVQEAYLEELVKAAVEQVLAIDDAVEEQLAELPNYVDNKYLKLAASALPIVLHYLVNNIYDVYGLDVDEVNEKFDEQVRKALAGDPDFDDEEFYAIGEAEWRKLLYACVELSVNAINKLISENLVYIKALEGKHYEFAEKATPIIMYYFFKLDWAEVSERKANEIVELINDEVTKALQEQSTLADEYIQQYLLTYQDVYVQIVEQIQTVLKTSEEYKNKFLEALEDIKPYVPYAEQFIYANIAEVYNTIKLVSAIKLINPDAQLLVLGMYNQLEGVEVVLNGEEVDLGKYSEIWTESSDFIYTNIAAVTGAYTYVPLTDVETVASKEGITIDLDTLGAQTIGTIIVGLYDSIFANAEGQNDIYEAIMDCIITWVEGVELDLEEATINAGETVQLYATVYPFDATLQDVIWTSSDEQIATVDENGLVTGIASGVATITVTTVDQGFTATCEITVNVPVEGIELADESVKLFIGKNYELVAKIFPEEATNKNIIWESSDDDVVVVDDDGNVTAKAEGTAVVTATTEDGEFVAECEFDVYPKTTDKTGTTAADISYEIDGDDVFAVVEADLACVVIAKVGDEYTKLDAIKVSDGKYKYDITAFADEDVEIIVAVKGDYNLDGKVSTVDVAQANLAILEREEVSDVKKLIFDASDDDKFTTNDVALVNASIVDRTGLDW